MDATCEERLFKILMVEEIKSIEELATHLDLSDTDFTNACGSKKSEGTKRLAVFREWKRQNGSDATCAMLVRALLTIKDTNTAEVVIRYAKKNYRPPGE